MTTTPRPYFRPTTAGQRQLLFDTWRATGNVSGACQTAHVGRGTFYRWLPRYKADELAGVREMASRAPLHPHRVSAEVAAEAVALRRAHPSWGKTRLADEMAQAHGGHRVISPNVVRRVLTEAGEWPQSGPRVSPAPTLPVRNAEQAGQTVNVDLAFLPVTHEPLEPLPAVTGSSGRLRIIAPAKPMGDCPGCVFGNSDLEYAEAMRQFAAASAAVSVPQVTLESPAENTPPAAPEAAAACQAHPELPAESTQPANPEAAAARQAEAQLRDTRRAQREKRRAEDTAWRIERQVWKDQIAPSAEELARQRRRRTDQLARRQQRAAENAAWRAERQKLREQLATGRLITAWIAVLVVIDNCTRQCYGVPLFANGRHVTAAQVVAALRDILPPGVEFVISDRGIHFTAQAFKDLEQNLKFLHVFTARHRPQSNGIAERFVRTYKAWLADKTWHTPEELDLLAHQFLTEYNNRPHQGLPIPGLSPNELARCIWLL